MEESNQTSLYDIESCLETLITKKLSNLAMSSSNCSIYTVPDRLRKINEQAYSPRVVSIGPLHHGRENLRAMEEQKRRYLHDFLCRTGAGVKKYTTKIWHQEAKLRSYYAEPIPFSTDEFVEIILLDAIFIIEVLLRNSDKNLQVENDRIFNKPWMLGDIWPDMLLLENQLPLFILDDLFDPEISSKGDSIISLSCNFFHEAFDIVGADAKLKRSDAVLIEHFVDLVRSVCLPPTIEDSKPGGKRQKTIPSISELYLCGVKVELGSTRNLFDIQFADGILKIPKLEISGVTEVIIRNLIALEQCHYPWNNTMSVYALTMDRLVNTPTDVAVLVHHGIFENMLGNNWEAATMINNLGSGVSVKGFNFHYASLYESLNTYSKLSWNRWKANLKQTYFNTPWTTMKVVAAVVLLVLTLIQTVCSIISLA